MYKSEESIIEQVNNTKTECDYDKTVIEFFEHQVSENPQHCAVLTKNRSFTYKELNEKANSLARFLREIGVRRNTIVGIMVPRSVEMIIGIFAIIKSGGAYLPIDPDCPENRVDFILQDSGINIMLTCGDVKYEISNKIKLIDLEHNYLYTSNTSNITKVNEPNDLALIILVYTF